MKAWMWCAMVALCAAPVWAQGAGMEEGPQRMVAWVEAMGEFVGKARFNEADLKSFLEHYDSFNRLGEEDDDEYDDRFYKDGKYHVALILEDKEFVKWAADRGLDRGVWLKKTMRIISVVMKRQVAGQFDEYEKMLKQQLAELEGSREDMGEEMYAQVKKGIEDSAAMMKQMREAFNALPDPSEEEAKLLEKYKKELSRIMEDEGCGEDEGWEEDEDWGDEEEGCE